ncbi:MAG: GNAT family N-acetyltransferase [Bacteroidetes bacterium]|nr:GNAT family N-acetyltransferase [Bacteroidota bacterium]
MFNFCKPINTKKRFTPHRSLSARYSFTLFESAALVNENEWNEVCHNNALFLNLNYLALLEKLDVANVFARYSIIYKSKKPVGIIYFQIVDFKASVFGNLFQTQLQAVPSKRIGMMKSIINHHQNETLLRLFTCGNNNVSGPHGYNFTTAVPEKIQVELLNRIIDIVSKEEKLKSSISAVLIKDFYSPLVNEKCLTNEGYTRFSVEPNMILEVPENVFNLEDYIALFSKKYRNRVKSILKKSSNLQVKELSLGEIIVLEPFIYKLYEQVYDKAKFKLAKLQATYFSEVKKIFNNRFSLKGVFNGDQLLAFCSSFYFDKDTVEAHYVGINYTLNSNYDLYQNLLYSLIKSAISHNCRKINFGRTASEIKSTTGAKAHELMCYIKPQNTISKLIQKPFIKFLQPEPWIPRNPFKEEDDLGKV